MQVNSLCFNCSVAECFQWTLWFWSEQITWGWWLVVLYQNLQLLYPGDLEITSP